MQAPKDIPNRQRNRRGEGNLLRDELLSAALRVLENPLSEGRLSVRAVAAEAGVAPQSVYLQFPDAAALRWAAFARLFQVLAAKLDAATDGKSDASSALKAWALAYVDFAHENSGRYQAMFGAVGELQAEWGLEDLPGAAVFESLREIVAAMNPTTEPSETFVEALCLWATLHGLASLQISKPSFPWPPLGSLISRALDTHVRVDKASDIVEPQTRTRP